MEPQLPDHPLESSHVNRPSIPDPQKAKPSIPSPSSSQESVIKSVSSDHLTPPSPDHIPHTPSVTKTIPNEIKQTSPKANKLGTTIIGKKTESNPGLSLGPSHEKLTSKTNDYSAISLTSSFRGEMLESADMNQIMNYGKNCLSQLDHLNLTQIRGFCKCLKEACEHIRAASPESGKANEKEFCKKIINELLKETKSEASRILKMDISPEEKAMKLDRLADVFLGLSDLTQVQSLFGGRLAFHCLPHSQGVALGAGELTYGTKNEFAAFSAGAAHDLVMKYQKSPFEEKPKFDAIKNGEKTFGDKMVLALTKEAPVHVTTSDVGTIKMFKGISEQKRNPGIEKGCSERDSLDQLLMEREAARKELFSEIGQNNPEIGIRLNQLAAEKDEFIKTSILKTVPRLIFAPPNLGTKPGTVSNAGVLPDPLDLVDLYKNNPTLASKLITLQDQFCGQNTANYSKAVNDITQFRNCYSAADFNSANENGLSFKLPSYLLPARQFFAAAMPGYDDPAVHLSTNGEAVQLALTQVLKNSSLDVLQYLHKQVMNCGVPASDLGALLEKDCATNWVRSETVALAMEENPYDADAFFKVHEKIKNQTPFKLGLEDPEVHEKMKTEEGRAELGIHFDEYRAVVKFMSIISFFIKDQKSFAEGRMRVVQVQMYRPMKALQQAIQEKKNDFTQEEKDFFTQEKIDDLDVMIENFEEKFCEGGQLRDAVQQPLNEFYEECKNPATCCSNVFKEAARRWGPDFLAHPTQYGFTTSSQENDQIQIVQPSYLSEQGDSLIIHSLSG